mmetsp:Transcript_140912/g.449703  ORF Transcript_140912/g.449703 Transcript_140912/m.449703 type:complete len:375 (-) Transcript_140912:277-1401(-)
MAEGEAESVGQLARTPQREPLAESQLDHRDVRAFQNQVPEVAAAARICQGARLGLGPILVQILDPILTLPVQIRVIPRCSKTRLAPENVGPAAEVAEVVRIIWESVDPDHCVVTIDFGTVAPVGKTSCGANQCTTAELGIQLLLGEHRDELRQLLVRSRTTTAAPCSVHGSVQLEGLCGRLCGGQGRLQVRLELDAVAHQPLPTCNLAGRFPATVGISGAFLRVPHLHKPRPDLARATHLGNAIQASAGEISGERELCLGPLEGEVPAEACFGVRIAQDAEGGRQCRLRAAARDCNGSLARGRGVAAGVARGRGVPAGFWRGRRRRLRWSKVFVRFTCIDASAVRGQGCRHAKWHLACLWSIKKLAFLSSSLRC